MSSSNPMDIFNVTPDLSMDNMSSENSVEFRPSYKKSKTGVYEAVIRFIPNPADPNNKSIIRKNTATLVNPFTKESRTVDCPSTVGRPDPIVNTFFALRDSPNAIKKEQSAVFSRRQKYASYIQVIDCKVQPNIVNKIFIWNYGIKVYQKIQAELNPTYGSPKNPFDLLNGRAFLVKVKEVSGYNNYDDCQFIDLEKSIAALRVVMPDKTGNTQVIPINEELVSNPQGKELVLKYLNENCPDITPYEYHDWDDATAKYVSEIIRMYTDPTYKPVNTPNPVMPQQPTFNQAMPTMQQPQQPLPNFNVGSPALNDLLKQQQSIAPTVSREPTSSEPGLGLSGIDAILKDTATSPTVSQPMPNPTQQSPNLNDILGNILV